MTKNKAVKMLAQMLYIFRQQNQIPGNAESDWYMAEKYWKEYSKNHMDWKFKGRIKEMFAKTVS